ncbi:uncharacterized protein BX663DRAFT_512624 [Cokeromyces recurvatus]|uniref:uncharacterized protein n=1 Tax=Cokeromyces recurvatus TaxID=90255 RepID=UPI00221F9C6D|nr:uncharacterized protein BX663DRAFT_512624 [Cokeromyces recurvatus]KAI7901853.1 hypothetical protein BX663DRAFT_512624 [Cokeromyces recurvatus]
MLNIAPYIPKYVRSLYAHNEHLEIPYNHSQFGVVLMVDVVGFSSLTTKATEKGDSGAEAVALEIGSYMGECIEIIEHFGGDVVKFLGDAVLVSFQPNHFDDNDDFESGEISKEKEARQKNVLVRRAVECGLQLLARLSHYRVYLTAEERTKHRSSLTGEIDRRSKPDKNQHFFLFDASGTNSSSESEGSSSGESFHMFSALDTHQNYTEEYSTSFHFWNYISALFGKGRNNSHTFAARRSSYTSEVARRVPDAIYLELHIALSCGKISNVILGDVKNSIYEPNERKRRFSYIGTDIHDPPLDYNIDYVGRLEYAICGPAVEALEEALMVANAGEMSITPEAYELFQNQTMNLTYEKRNQFYIVKNTSYESSSKKATRHYPSHAKALSKSNASYLADRPELMNRAATLNIEPLIPRTRDNSFLELSFDPNSNYLKHINRSALYRLQHSPEDDFTAQFREVTIMFISLGKLIVDTPEGLQIAQNAVNTAIQTIIKYEGILQQFAVDDKGATLLAVFGLPPLSHEREAVFAAKTAIELRESFLTILDDFAISLSTGIIFSAVLPQGNPYRRDPAIAGDTIVLAVRMLKFPFSKKNIICDFATKQQIGRICEFEDYGEKFVKGKVKPIHIYSILQFAPAKTKRISAQYQEKNSDFIGYKSEMRLATDFVEEWGESPNYHLLVISGPSGAGKSFFCHTLSRQISSFNTICCWSSSTEVEKSSKYYLVKNILLALFDIIESGQIPQNMKRRVSCIAGSSGAYTNDSTSHYFSNSENSVGSSHSSLAHSPTTISPKDNHNNHPLNILRQSLPTSNTSGSSVTDDNEEHMENANDLVDLITRCLRICGEEEKLLPLFKVIFAPLADLKDNKYIQRLDGRGRDILLTGTINRMVKYVSEHVGLVFISDDVQWADSASIRLLQHIHEHCQKVLLVFATRPVKDYNVTFINNFQETGSFEGIELNGLGATEIGEIILQTFQTAGVTSVSPEIVQVIQKRTAGNPLYVKNMAIVLKDFNHVSVIENVLVPSSNQFDLEDLLGNFDYKRTIKMQFDRLEGSYQEFLMVASCLDQYFTIAEVQSVIKESNTEFKYANCEEAQRSIEKYDVYHFIQKVDDSILENGSSPLYTFTHITIPQCIYDMVSYETRILLHRLLAKYYESELTRENYADLLGKVTRHYLQTDWLDKQLYYLEALADINIKSYLLPEATGNLERIVKILDENRSLAAQFGRLHRSDIYRRLGMCFAMRTKLKEGEHYLFQALECLGEPWPQSEPEFVFKYWVNCLVQYRHRKFPNLHKREKDLKKEIVKRVVEIMVQLSNIYFYTGKGRSFVYTCLVGLNACERLNEVGPHYTLFLARNSLLSWLNDEKEQSIFYITRALRYMDDKNDADTLTICALLCFAAGKFKNARELLYQSIDVVKTLGIITDCQAFYRSVSLIITMRIFEGTLDNSPDDLFLLKEMANTAHSNCDFEAEIWLSVYHVGNALIMDRLRECEPFVALLETHLKKSAEYNRIAIHGTLLCYYARTRNYENARRHTRSLVAILPLLTVTPNIFPIFGLIFATMGLYCMIEDEQVDLVSTGDSKNYDRFILGVSRINHAFQQVKFWEFTQPCLYLARALPYISTGRTVEGFMVLQHGVLEMRFIQEIRFLKAYYWANLGKYAFMPADRIEWTERAKADLEVLKIPSHVYCNPDPANSYSRDAPADLTV